MTDATRKYQFNRRNKSIADLSQKNMTTGKLTVAEVKASNLWKVNSVHQIGIATTAEIGLEAARWPVRVKIGPAVAYNPRADTVCKYWSIVNAQGVAVAFQTKAQFAEVLLARLYARFPDLDSHLWNTWNEIKNNLSTEAPSEGLVTTVNSLVQHLGVPAPTNEQYAAFSALVPSALVMFRAERKVPVLPLGNNYYFQGKPHGANAAECGGVSADNIFQVESILCAQLNYDRMKARYPDLPDGTITMCAYAVANMFRLGLYEQAAGEEFYTAYVTPGTGTAFTVTSVTKPPNAPDVANLALGAVIEAGNIKIDPGFVEIGSAFVAMAGVMHYSYNHTTGGSVLAGPVLAMACSFGIFDTAADTATQEMYTSLFYEALHPTNKRLIANVFFKKTGIITAGRHADAPCFMEMSVDSFVMIRTNPFPAGAHKAYVAGEVLKRVLSANLAPFLPWNSEINNCVNACREIIAVGARAHIGSRYYTGDAPTTQGSTLDNYMPDLAMYIQTMAKNDTLAMSPHLSSANAARASPSWGALLRSLKANDISGTDIELVKTYLQSAGQMSFSLDPANQETWKKSMEECATALNTLGELLG